MNDFKQLLKDLQNKIYHPLYLLHGEEPYYIDQATDYFEHRLLSESERSFNQTVIYGKDASYMALQDTLVRYPMMANYQVVILKEAQQFKDLDKLEKYFEHPVRSTIFVICYKYKKLDGRSRAYKLLSTKGVVVESKKLYDNQVPAFIESVAREKKVSVSHDAVDLLAEYLGTDLSKIVHEIEKLAVNVKDGVTVSTHHIEKYIGISREYNTFALTNALAQRDHAKTFRIVKYFEKNPKAGEPVMVLGMLYSFFSKALVLQTTNASPSEMSAELQIRSRPMMEDLKTYIKKYKTHETVKNLHAIHECDLKIKGVEFGSDKSVVLTELAYRILN